LVAVLSQSPLLGSPLFGSPLLGSPLLGSPLLGFLLLGFLLPWHPKTYLNARLFSRHNRCGRMES